MIRKTILTTVLALCGLSVSAPAQKARFGASIRTADFAARVAHDGVRVEFGQRDSRRTPRREVTRRGRSDRVYGRGRSRARSHGHVHSRGYWKNVRQRVWVDGYYENVHVPAQWGYRLDECGRRIRYCVREAYYDRVWRPGCWRYETRRVWVSRRC